MIDLGAVGARFTILDEASPVLKAITTQLERLDQVLKATRNQLARFSMPPGVNRALLAMQENMTRLEAVSQTAGTGIVANFGRVDAAIAGTQARVAALAADMRALGSGSRLPAIGGGGGGSRVRPGAPRSGGSGSGGGVSVGGPGFGLPGGSHVNLGHGAAMAGLGAIAYGVYLQSEIEDIAARALMTGQIHVDAGMTQTEAYKQVRKTIQDVSAKTGFSPKEVGEAILVTERQFGGLGFKERLGLEETLIPFAAAEARMKETSLKESFESMVGLAHMTGTYDPKKLPELMRQFSYASMITPVGLPQFKNALSYSMPMLTAGLDMDPAAVMFLTAMTQTAGVTNTKSGTWLRSFFENAEPRLGHHLSKGAISHNDALKSMGLLDAKNRVTWQVKGANGKTDWDSSIVKMSELINKFTSTTDPAHRLSILRTAFGERGGGEAALMNLTEFIKQFPILQAKMAAAQGGDHVLDSLQAGSPVQQARTAWADLENVLMDIGQSVLPPLTAALHGFDAVLKLLHKSIGDSGANALVGGGVLGGAAAWFGRSQLGRALPLFANPAFLAPAVLGGGLAAIAASASPEERKALTDAQAATDALHLPALGKGGPGGPAGFQPFMPSLPDAIGDSVNRAVEQVPAKVDPTVKSAFGQIQDAIVGAIQGLAAAARAAAAAIPSGVPAPAAVEHHTELHVDGRKLASAVTRHIAKQSTMVASGADFDARRHVASVDQWAYQPA